MEQMSLLEEKDMPRAKKSEQEVRGYRWKVLVYDVGTNKFVLDREGDFIYQGTITGAKRKATHDASVSDFGEWEIVRPGSKFADITGRVYARLDRRGKDNPPSNIGFMPRLYLKVGELVNVEETGWESNEVINWEGNESEIRV